MKSKIVCFWSGTVLAVLTFIAFALHVQAQHGGGGRGGGGMRGGGGGHVGGAPPRGYAHAARPGFEHHPGRFEYGSIHHADAPVFRDPRFNRFRHFGPEIGRGHFFFGGFVPGVVITTLPYGYETLDVNNTPYYYSDGMYYQSVPDGYQEVYPPIGAAVIQLPPGTVPIIVGNVTYYYAGGTFYVQQGNQFVVVATPIGVTVPDLPPGAVQVSVNGRIGYQFNNIYYLPIFINGVTQYVTSLTPQ